MTIERYQVYRRAFRRLSFVSVSRRLHRSDPTTPDLAMFGYLYLFNYF
jgi:hypothetical protein